MKRVLALAALIGALTVVGVYQVLCAFEGMEIGVAVSEESERYQRIIEERRRLRGELAALKQPARIEEAAARLGLRVARDTDVVRASQAVTRAPGLAPAR